MDVRNSKVYHTTLQNQDHCLKIGTDYAGPIYYKTKKKNELKAYILLFSCSVTRAVHIELVSNLTTTEFIKSLKRLIPKPKIGYSVNAKTSRQGRSGWQT